MFMFFYMYWSISRFPLIPKGVKLTTKLLESINHFGNTLLEGVCIRLTRHHIHDTCPVMIMKKEDSQDTVI